MTETATSTDEQTQLGDTSEGSTSLACAWCGVRAPRPDDPGLLLDQDLSDPLPEWRADRPVRYRAVKTTEWGRCAECVAVQRHAETLVRSHPRAAAKLGEHGAVDAITGVLVALDRLGEPHPTTEATDRELGLLVRHLAQPGRALRWWLTAEPGTSTSSPWDHVDDEARGSLRKARAALLAERVARDAPPRRVQAPDVVAVGTVLGGGCLLCGVGHVMVPAADALRGVEAWRQTTVSPVGLGLHGPGTVTGLLCRHCDEAVTEAGAIGPTAAERSLVQHLRRSGRNDEARALGHVDGGGERPRLLGVRSWGSTAYAAEQAGLPLPGPNEASWEHVRTKV